MGSRSTVIETHALTRHFGDVTAVADLGIEVHEGEIFGFLGHNGAGKTTTVRLLNGILAPTSGSVKLLGLDPIADGPDLRRRTGVLTETPSLDDRLTARETLSLFGELYGVPRSGLPSHMTHLLETFQLADRADELVGGYSKGMRQRLALARTLIHQPTVIFLDEPTGGLDPVARRGVHDLITQLSDEEGRTVFLCTHDLAEAQKLCDRVGVMEKGRLVALGTPQELARNLQRGVRLVVEVAARPAWMEEDRERGPDSVMAAGWDLAWDEDQRQVRAWLPTREDIPALIRELVRAGARIYSVALEEATLEDVYFALQDAARGEERSEGVQ